MHLFRPGYHVEYQRQLAALTLSSLCILLVLIFVALRLWAKSRTSKRFDASDVCSILAMLLNTAFHVNVYAMVLVGGFGYHVQDIVVLFGPDYVLNFFKAITAFPLIWNATTLFTKLSILFMYTTLFPVRSMILACRILGAIIIVWNVAGIIAGLTICRPFAYNWDRSIPGGRCGKQPMYYMGLGVINIVIEVILICLPFPLVYKLQMPLRSRLVVIGMFSVGLGTIVITIYRQATLPYIKFEDMPYSGFVATVFAAVEPSIAVCIACVPFLRPYFNRNVQTATPKHGLNVDYGPDRTKKNNDYILENLDRNTSESQLELVDQLPRTYK